MSIESPASTDVLCGKDKTYGKWAGNIIYRHLIQAKARDYATAPTKQEKMRLTKQIVAELMTVYGSRFLKCCNSTSGGWVELSAAQARDKTSHALRFCVQNTPGMEEAANIAASNSSRSVSPITGPSKRPCEESSVESCPQDENQLTFKKSRNESVMNMSPSAQATNALSILALAVESHCQQPQYLASHPVPTVQPPVAPSASPIVVSSTASPSPDTATLDQKLSVVHDLSTCTMDVVKASTESGAFPLRLHSDSTEKSVPV